MNGIDSKIESKSPGPLYYQVFVVGSDYLSGSVWERNPIRITKIPAPTYCVLQSTWVQDEKPLRPDFEPEV